MTLNEIKKIPTKYKTNLVSQACFLYRKLLAQSRNNELTFSRSIQEQTIGNIKSISMFETIMALLSEEYMFIIDKEFLHEKENSEYYNVRWCKTTYYKVRNEAVDHFVYLLFA